MFSSTKRVDHPYPTDSSPTPSFGARSATTVIAKGVRVEGEFRSEGDVVIEGDIKGSISAQGTLTIGSDAHIEADISAEEANISGTIHGNITIKKEAVFHASADIRGDVNSECIVIESGARIDGKIHVGSSDAKTPEVKPTASSLVLGSATPSVSAPVPIQAPASNLPPIITLPKENEEKKDSEVGSLPL